MDTHMIILNECMAVVPSIVLLYMYRASNVHYLTNVICIVTWCLSFNYFTILPYDVYIVCFMIMQSAQSGSQASLVRLWRCIFWTLFALNWFLVPLVRFYHSSGYLLPRQKLKDSVVFNSTFYCIMILVGLFFFIYLFIQKSLHFADSEVFVISLSNCWGLILMFLFLAPGLVDIPVTMWRKINLLGQQQELEYEAGSLSNMQDDLFYELENQVKILYNIGKQEKGESYCVSIDTIIKSVPASIIDQFPTGLDSYFPKDLYENDLDVIFRSSYRS